MTISIGAYRDLQLRLLSAHGVLSTLSVAHSHALDDGNGLSADAAENEYYCILDTVQQLRSCVEFLDSLDVLEGGEDNAIS